MITWIGNPGIKRLSEKINELIKDIMRNDYSGIGKPEPLRGDLSGWWSRRINDADRIVCKVDGDTCVIAQVKGHY